MKIYIVTSALGLTINSGQLKLSKEQAAARSHVLKSNGKDHYVLTGATQFKIGEQFGYDGDLPKNLVDQLVSAPKGAKPATLDAKEPGLIERALGRVFAGSETKSADEKMVDAEQSAADSTAQTGEK